MSNPIKKKQKTTLQDDLAKKYKELIMQDKHLSTQFDEDLNDLSKQLLVMAGEVEAQMNHVIHALMHHDQKSLTAIAEHEKRINTMEKSLDADCCKMIAIRQPTARDLRLVLAISKAVTNLERAGDEADKMGRRLQHIWSQDHKDGILESQSIEQLGSMARSLLKQSLDAFARLSTTRATDIFTQDKDLDLAFATLTRALILI